MPRLRVVTASEAAKNFGALVDAVREEHAVYVVERAGTPVVHIVPVVRNGSTLADLAAQFRDADRLDATCLREIELGVAFLNQPSIPLDPWAS
jgi:prevent-host-death family protein